MAAQTAAIYFLTRGIRKALEARAASRDRIVAFVDADHRLAGFDTRFLQGEDTDLADDGASLHCTLPPLDDEGSRTPFSHPEEKTWHAVVPIGTGIERAVTLTRQRASIFVCELNLGTIRVRR